MRKIAKKELPTKLTSMLIVKPTQMYIVQGKFRGQTLSVNAHLRREEICMWAFKTVIVFCAFIRYTFIQFIIIFFCDFLSFWISFWMSLRSSSFSSRCNVSWKFLFSWRLLFILMFLRIILFLNLILGASIRYISQILIKLLIKHLIWQCGIWIIWKKKILRFWIVLKILCIAFPNFDFPNVLSKVWWIKEVRFETYSGENCGYCY